ncbi:unnamed protein product [Effrenium voratum]|nr:unnamed protein product [Effrenium voratum]
MSGRRWLQGFNLTRRELLCVHRDHRCDAQISAFLSVVSPTSFVRKGELLQAPGETFPRTGLAYMPKDVSFASEEATTTLLGSLQNLGVAAKAWAVHPRRLTPADFADRFRSAGLVIQDHAVERFIEALSDLGLVDGGEVLDDPRRFPWERAISLLNKDTPPASRKLRLRCAEELLNRAWAQHEFALADIASEVLDFLLPLGKEVTGSSEL